jgi:predicted nucleic acid-binding protein
VTERWVINASPLILLGKAGQLSWLPELGELVIPQAVADEIMAGSEDDSARQWLAFGKGKTFVTPDAPVPSELGAWDLGSGETSVLAWAIRQGNYEAILDDSAARRCALVFGVPVRGTLGLVVLAKRRGLITKCRPVFASLTTSGLFITRDLLEQAAIAA